MSEAQRRLNAKVDEVGHSGVQPWSAGTIFPFVIVRTVAHVPENKFGPETSITTWQAINGPHGQATAEFYSYDAAYEAARAVLDLFADNAKRSRAGSVLDGVAFSCIQADLDRAALANLTEFSTRHTMRRSLVRELYDGLLAASAYLVPPASKFRTNREDAGRIIRDAIARAEREGVNRG